jgi:hypothetical protein
MDWQDGHHFSVVAVGNTHADAADAVAGGAATVRAEHALFRSGAGWILRRALIPPIASCFGRRE